MGQEEMCRAYNNKGSKGRTLVRGLGPVSPSPTRSVSVNTSPLNTCCVAPRRGHRGPCFCCAGLRFPRARLRVTH